MDNCAISIISWDLKTVSMRSPEISCNSPINKIWFVSGHKRGYVYSWDWIVLKVPSIVPYCFFIFLICKRQCLLDTEKLRCGRHLYDTKSIPVKV